MVPAHGFEVHESVPAALAATYPPEARYLHAPRALLEVMVGGQPLVTEGAATHHLDRCARPRILRGRPLTCVRALLSGGAAGRICFVQLTPVRLLADPERFAALHQELFGDAYYLPAPPLTVVEPDEDEPPPRPAARGRSSGGSGMARAAPDALSVAVAALARAPWPELDASDTAPDAARFDQDDSFSDHDSGAIARGLRADPAQGQRQTNGGRPMPALT